MKLGISKNYNRQVSSNVKWLTDGTNNLFTSSLARRIFTSMRLGVSSHWIKTWSSSFKCSQLGLPRFASSWNLDKLGNVNIQHIFADCNFDLNDAKTNQKTRLLLVPHRSFAADHNFTSCFCLQLLGGHASRSQNASNKVVFWKFFGRNKNLLLFSYNFANCVG